MQKSFDKRDFGLIPEAVRQRTASPCERPRLLIMDLISQRGTTLAPPESHHHLFSKGVGGGYVLENGRGADEG